MSQVRVLPGALPGALKIGGCAPLVVAGYRPRDAARFSPRACGAAEEGPVDARGDRRAIRVDRHELGSGERRGAPRAPPAWTWPARAARRWLRSRVACHLPASR